MQLDQCLEYPHTEKDAERPCSFPCAGRRGHGKLWQTQGDGQFWHCAVSVNERLRRASARALDIGLKAMRLAGWRWRRPEAMLQAIEFTAPELPKDKPRYLMGLARRKTCWSRCGTIDMFDCVCRHAPGGMGRLSRFGKVNLRSQARG
jgi:queuine tRNA-ribosyltransferase